MNINPNKFVVTSLNKQNLLTMNLSECALCDRKLSSKSNFKKHMSSAHGIKLDKRTVFYNESDYQQKCLECKISFRGIDGLRNHLEVVHSFPASVEKREFPNVEEFLIWLEKLKDDNYEEFLSKGKNKKKKKDGTEVFYYVCSRSSTTAPTKGLIDINERKRKLKSQGSKKLKHACTSEVVLEKRTDGRCFVTFFKTHYGHELEVQHVHLPGTIRNEVASKLNEGVPATRVLDSLRKTVLKRSALVKRSDIRNIARAYKLNMTDNIPDDAANIDSLVEELENSEDDPVLFFKRQGDQLDNFMDDDFIIILMNETQKSLLKTFGTGVVCIDLVNVDTNRLSNAFDYQMTTILVRDEFGVGFLVASMFTNCKDEMVFDIFFLKLREEVGLVTPIILMTDFTAQFYNNWEEIMGPPDNHFFCSWQVDRAWRKNLTKIKIQEKREIVYKAAKVLQHDILEEVEFNTKLGYFIKKCNDDPDLQLFGKYFKNEYSCNYRKWSYCFREDMNKDVSEEEFQKYIKHVHIVVKKVKRLDKAMRAVLKFIRDKIIERLVKLNSSSVVCDSAQMSDVASVSESGLNHDSELDSEVALNHDSGSVSESVITYEFASSSTSVLNSDYIPVSECEDITEEVVEIETELETIPTDQIEESEQMEEKYVIDENDHIEDNYEIEETDQIDENVQFEEFHQIDENDQDLNPINDLKNTLIEKLEKIKQLTQYSSNEIAIRNSLERMEAVESLLELHTRNE